MNGEEGSSPITEPGVESTVEENESYDMTDSPPPLEEFGNLTAWAGSEGPSLASPEEEEIPPGATRNEVMRPKRYGRWGFIIFVLLGAVVTIVGIVERQGLATIIKRLPFRGVHHIELLDPHNGKLLMLETYGDSSRVIVQTPGQASWQLVSRDDTTATNPALSPDGRSVAYVSAQEDGQIVVVSLVDDAQHRITSKEILDIAKKASFSTAKVCPWTPVAWSPDGYRVAFFGCRKKPPLSMAFVANLSGSSVVLSIVPDSEVETDSPRQLQWSGAAEVTISVPSNDAQSGDRMKTLPVP